MSQKCDLTTLKTNFFEFLDNDLMILVISSLAVVLAMAVVRDVIHPSTDDRNHRKLPSAWCNFLPGLHELEHGSCVCKHMKSDADCCLLHKEPLEKAQLNLLVRYVTQALETSLPVRLVPFAPALDCTGSLITGLITHSGTQASSRSWKWLCHFLNFCFWFPHERSEDKRARMIAATAECHRKWVVSRPRPTPLVELSCCTSEGGGGGERECRILQQLLILFPPLLPEEKKTQTTTTPSQNIIENLQAL